MQALHPDAITLDRIRLDTNGLADLADQVPLDQPVTTCGEWSLADLLWHLFEVQHFWCYIIGARPAGPDDYVRPDRPADSELAAGLRSANERLLSLLAESDPAEEAWSWADDQTVGFTVRRQTHEAMVHHIDGLLAAGLDLPDTPPRLGADGVDEILGVMLSVESGTEGFELDGTSIELATSDTDDRWTLGFGAMSRVGDDGETVSVPALTPISGAAAPSVTVTGPALALNLWLWGRNDGSAITVDGDSDVIERLFTLIAGVSG